jgi:hypothetical protein
MDGKNLKIYGTSVQIICFVFSKKYETIFLVIVSLEIKDTVLWVYRTYISCSSKVVKEIFVTNI